MDTHRCVPALSVKVFPIRKGFSCFDFVEDRYGDLASLRRCFSLARSFDFQTLVIEPIPPRGMIQDENDELATLFPGYACAVLERLSFWRCDFDKASGIDSATDDDLIGYAIVKHDRIPAKAKASGHVFEAAFRKYDHSHNCVPCRRLYTVQVGNRDLSIPGRLYCQQNELNKACAQVALRSLLSAILPDGDIAYSRINELARPAGKKGWSPADGLSADQIRKVLDDLGVGYRDINYGETEKKDPAIRQSHPFQKYLYAGIESGSGALLGFSMAGPGLNEPGKHIIPFFGHTFNKDTWVPDAQQSYFDVGGGMGYLPSESWTSSFLGHDDNFGPNYCVPRLYVRPEQVDYVSELLSPGCRFSGVQAEAISIRFVYSFHPNIAKNANRWLRRLALYSHPDVQQIVLRAVSASRDQYVAHLKEIEDWDGHRENPALPGLLAHLLPPTLWVVEISIPHLFPANERKLGEVVLDATNPLDEADPLSFAPFRLARVPTQYFLVSGVNKKTPQFIKVPSSLESHVELLRL